MDRVIMIKYGELTTKKGNRNFFVNALYKSIKDKLSGYNVNISRDLSRMYIEFDNNELDSILKRINNIFGIHGYLVAYKVLSDVEVIKNTVLDVVNNEKFDTFKEIFVEKKNQLQLFQIEKVNYSKGMVILKLKGIETPEQAETLRNCYIKMDRKNAKKLPEGTYYIADLIGLDVYSDEEELLGKVDYIYNTGSSDIYVVKNDEGKEILLPAIKDVLKQVVECVPAPKGDNNAPLKALIFDSYYDNFKGAVCVVRVVDGTVKKGDKIKFFTTGHEFDVVEVGIFCPQTKEQDMLSAGDVGYISASIKTVVETRVGDTITNATNPADSPLPGYKEVKPVVFSGIFCVDGAKYNDLKDALEKLRLNDASLEFVPEVSQALGFGFRCGFLGLLHMDIIQERLEREFDLDLITTAPTVNYRIYKRNGTMIEISNPAEMPAPQEIDHMEEPIARVNIFTPPEYIGDLINLCQERRGVQQDLQYIDTSRCQMIYKIPLNEIIFDFFDQLKSRSRGYASLDYEIIGYEPSELVKLDILLNGDVCDALSLIVHKDKAYARGRAIAEKLKDVIPRQMFEVPIQAAIGSKVIARETIKAMRKDVLAKCYGGDVTRKRKLLEKQKRGKKKMRQIGSVEIPSEAFISILKID